MRPGTQGVHPERSPTTNELMREAGIESIDLLKMDIEVTEAAIVESNAPWLDALRNIIIEIHSPYSVDLLTHAKRRARLVVLPPDRQMGTQMTIATRWNT